MLDIQKLLKEDDWELEVNYIGNGLKNLQATYRVPLDPRKLKIILRKILWPGDEIPNWEYVVRQALLKLSGKFYMSAGVD